MSFVNLFHYGFVIRALEAGTIIAIIAPLIGTFLVLRRYSLIADTLAHVSFAGLAIGAWLGLNLILTALATTILAALGMERLRTARRVYGESALALFLSGSLALAVVILSVAHGFNVNLFSYLFGSIVTVTPGDVILIAILAVIVIAILAAFYKELVYITFDEEAAHVSGIPTRFINVILILLTAVTVSLSIPIVGVLLISALIVIPVVTALRFRTSFTKTILIAEAVSLFSVLAGIVVSFYADIAAGGTIVLIMLAMFVLALVRKG